MSRVIQFLSLVVLSLIIGAAISYGTKITAVDYHSDLSPGCVRGEVITGCTDVEQRGFPIWYDVTSYETGDKAADGIGYDVNTFHTFAETHFIINSLIWSGGVFVIALIATLIVSKFTPRPNSKTKKKV